MKKVYVIAIVVVLILVGLLWAYFLDRVPQGKTTLSFTEIEFPFNHEYDDSNSLPFMALSAIDVNDDGIQEIFAGGGANQADRLYFYNDALKKFEEVKQAGFEDKEGDPTYGAASIDANGDSLVDLFVARKSGVKLYLQKQGSGFSLSEASFPLAENTVPLSFTFSDLNGDGRPEIFVAGYIRFEQVEGETIFNEPYGGYSAFFVSEGDGWVDKTEQAGLHRQHNTFQGILADLNEDAKQDLIVAQDTGHVLVFENLGNLRFKDRTPEQAFSYPMGIAVGDYNSDGKIDFQFSNVGYTIPEFMLRGDLRDDQQLNRDYLLWENQGDFRFKDQARATNSADWEFAWGTIMADFNNDTRQDLMIAQNYIRFPMVSLLEKHSGRLLQQTEEGSFEPVEEVAGLSNRDYGLNVLASDFNGDGKLDVVLNNIDGPIRAFLSSASEEGNWLRIRFPDSPEFMGTRVEATLNNGSKVSDVLVSGEGLSGDQESVIHLGLGSQGIQELLVQIPGKEVISVAAPAINRMVPYNSLK